MTQKTTFGVVGGYGATGRVVVSELCKSRDGDLLIGGRDLAKARAVAAEFGNKVSAAHLDVLDQPSLDEFCSRCSIVVNCAGPATLLQDRVAQAALRESCHYIDTAGMSLLKERMLPWDQQIIDGGLSFVVSAGWMPGITEVLAVYADAQARAEMDSIESLTIYFSDSGEWSNNALRDGVWYIRRVGLRSPGYFRRGEWTRARMSAAFRRFDLGNTVGRRWFCMYSTPELNEIGRQFRHCDVLTYTYLSGFRNTFATTLIAMLPLPEAWSVRLLRNVFRRNRLPVDGFAVAQVLGHSQGHKLTRTARVFYSGRRDYWIHGVVVATVARMVSEGKGVKVGVHFLSDAVDASAFMAELRRAGVEQSENLERCE